MKYLVYFAIMLAMLYFAGNIPMLLRSFRNTPVKFPEKLLLGASITMLLCFWSNYAGISFRKSTYAIATLLVCVGVWAMCKSKESICYFKQNAHVYVLAILAGCLAIMPVISLGITDLWSDEYTYICQADWLTNNSFSNYVGDIDTKPYLSQIKLYQDKNLRIGVQMMMSFFSCFFREKFSAELYAPMAGVGITLGCCAAICVVDKLIHSSRVQMLAVCFVGFNVTIQQRAAIYGVLPQLFGLAFLTWFLAELFTCFPLDGDIHIGSSYEKKTTLTLAFALCSLGIAYSELLPFACVEMFAVILFCIIHRRVFLLKRIIIIAATSVVLLNIYLPKILKGIINQSKSADGMEIHTKTWFDYVAYLFSTVPDDYQFVYCVGAGKYIYGFLTFGLVSIMLFGMIRLRIMNNNHVNVAFAVLSVPYLVLCVYFTCFSFNPYNNTITGNTWGVYKLVQYYLCVFAPFIAVYVYEALMHHLLFFLIIYIVLNSFNAYNTALNGVYNEASYYTIRTRPIEDYYAVSDAYNMADKKIALVNVPLNDAKALSYFLQDCDLYCDLDGTQKGLHEYSLSDEVTFLAFDKRVDSDCYLRVQSHPILVRNLDGATLEANDAHTWMWFCNQSMYEIINYSGKESSFVVNFGVATTNGDNNTVRVSVNGEGQDYSGINSNEITNLHIPVRLKKNEKLIMDIELLNSENCHTNNFAVWDISIE